MEGDDIGLEAFLHVKSVGDIPNFMPAIVTERGACNSCCGHLSVSSGISILRGNLDLVANEARQDAKETVPFALCMRLEAFMDIFT